MGDRGFVVIHDGDLEHAVALYAHWKGSDLPEIVANALTKKWRWTDTSYLARIIFDELVGDDHLKDEYSYGITTGDQQEENPTVYVNTAGPHVVCLGESFTFEKFIELFSTAAKESRATKRASANEFQPIIHVTVADAPAVQPRGAGSSETPKPKKRRAVKAKVKTAAK